MAGLLIFRLWLSLARVDILRPLMHKMIRAGALFDAHAHILPGSASLATRRGFF
jgi:hypothetical protein